MDNPVFAIKEIEGFSVATVAYADGTLFTVSDWQGQQPQSADEIEQYSWSKVDPSDPANTDEWTPAVFVLGWPRTMI